jgi:transcriptional regulator with XRE-family HTH domain
MIVYSAVHKAIHLHFPKRLADLRQELHMTTEQLAEKTSIEVKQLKRFESGYAKPTLDEVHSIADALGVGIDVLLGLPVV